MTKEKISVRITNIKNDKAKNLDSAALVNRFYLGKQVNLDGTESKKSFAIIGQMFELKQGRVYEVDGIFKETKSKDKYGNETTYTNFIVDNIDYEVKLDKGSIISYLVTEFKGLSIRKKKLMEIFDAYGQETYDIIKSDPDLFFSGKQLEGVKERMGTDSIESFKILTYLQEYGFNSAQVNSVVSFYGNDLKKIKFELTNSPYSFVIGARIKGVGFKTVDNIALNRGIALDDEQRLSAGIEFALQNAESDGCHCFLTKNQLLLQLMNDLGFKDTFAKAYLEKNNLNISTKQFFNALKKEDDFGFKHKDAFNKEIKPFKDKIKLIIEDKIKKSEIKSRKIPKKYILRDMECENKDALYDAYYLPYLFYRENFIAEKLIDITSIESDYNKVYINKILSEMIQEDLDSGVLKGNGLTDEQKESVIGVVTNKVSILTGSAGTGKTLTTKYILKVFRALGIKDIAVTAPTGKAADKAGKITCTVGRTIHSLLEYKFDGCGRNEDNPLTNDVIIIDEFSMLDLSLTHALLKAIQSKTTIVLIGDVEQLPSVGSGFISGDFMESGVVSTFRLTKVFRQENGSDLLGICDDCRLYNITRKMPKLNRVTTLKNLTYTEENMAFDLNDFKSEEQIIATINHLAKTIPERMGYTDIQFLTSQYKGMFGIDKLNGICQNIFNKNAKITKRLELANGLMDLKTGDRVIHLVNVKDMNMFNGEVGEVLYINDEKEKGEVGVYYPDGKGGKKLTVYNFKQLKMIKLAYCISTHKSQGGEYEVIFMFMTRQDYYMLERRLVYTAFTRAKKLLVIFYEGETITEDGIKPNILKTGLTRDSVIKRNTTIHYLLNKG